MNARPLAVIALALCPAVAADWPVDPSNPLILGQVESLAFVGAELASDPSGAAWTLWADAQCFGAMRLARIDPTGAVLVPDGQILESWDNCNPLRPYLAVTGDGAAVALGRGELLNGVRRIGPDGADQWVPPLVDPLGFGVSVGPALAMDNGDVILSGWQSQTILLTRIAPSGAAVWTEPVTSINPIGGGNKRIFALVADGADGAYLFWDEPTSYTRLIRVVRIGADGSPVWAEPLVVVPAVPGASRHSDPLALADGNGNAILVWTHGFESASTPAPVRVQRISGAGTFGYPPEGLLASLSGSRQFDVKARLDASTGNLLLAWRDGGFGAQTIHTQRLSPSGDRLHGPNGAALTALSGPAGGHFVFGPGHDAVIVSDIAAMPGDPTVRVLPLDSAGAPIDEWIVSDQPALGIVSTARLNGGFAVIWLHNTTGSVDELVAQRVNDDGTLGLPAGDVNGDGTVDVLDVLAVLAAWGPCPASCPADQDDDNFVNVLDLLFVLAHWS